MNRGVGIGVLQACPGNGRCRQQWRSRHGFTLLELLTVIVIMFMVMGIGVGTFLGYTRGAAMRGAVANIKGTLQLARQHAVTYQRSTAVLFNTFDADAYIPVTVMGICDRVELTNSNFAVFAMYPYGSRQNLAGRYVYNVSPSSPYAGRRTAIVNNFPDSIWISENIFNPDDRIGVATHTRRILPDGVEFEDPNWSQIVVFDTDGTSPTGDVTIGIRERGLSEDISQTRRVQVRGLTGWVREE